MLIKKKLIYKFAWQAEVALSTKRQVRGYIMKGINPFHYFLFFSVLFLVKIMNKLFILFFFRSITHNIINKQFN